MFRKAISLISLFLAATLAEPSTLNCGNKDVVACKVEFVKQLDIKLRDYFLGVTKQHIADIINLFETALKEIPDKGENAKLLKDSIKALQDGLAKYDDNKDDYEKLRNITHNVERNMQPHVMFAADDQKPIPDLGQILEKYNYTQTMEQVDIDEAMQAVGKMWQELFTGLRPNDLKEYPQYTDINEIAKQLCVQQDEEQFQRLGREFFKQVRRFCKIPSLEVLVFGEKAQLE